MTGNWLMGDKIYRVVREDGTLFGSVGRGSDPFTNKAAAKRRATYLTNQHRMYGGTRYKVQVAKPEWKDLDE